MSLKWQFVENWWGEQASFKVCNIVVTVNDLDGDSASFYIVDGNNLVNERYSITNFVTHDHFTYALHLAEMALRYYVKLKLVIR